nr:hypothetical protein [Massilia oculi]
MQLFDSGLIATRSKIRILLDWSKVNPPHVKLIKPSACIRIERDTHYDAIAILVLYFHKAIAQRPRLVSSEFKTTHPAVVHVEYLGLFQLAQQLLTVRDVPK